MQGSPYDVIIAGGGFVGRTLALALAKAAPRGFRIALIDAEGPKQPKQDARASALSAASKSLLSVLGVWDAVAPDAEPISSIDITDSELGASFRSHYLGFDDELKPGEPGAYIVENAGLQQLSLIHI